MTEKVTIREVAQAAGVSRSTVSRYFNHNGYLSDEARHRIETAIRRVGYEPNLVARGLKSGTSRMIVLSVPDIGNPYYARMAKAAQALCNAHGYALVLMDTGDGADGERETLALARQVCAAGILNATTGTCGHIPPVGIPMAGMCAYEEPGLHDVVTVSRSGGVCLAVQHLAALGHRRIAFVGGRRDSAIERGRLNSFLDQMAREGLPAPAALIRERGFNQEDGYAAARELMALPDRPTAMCCANDLLAFGAMRALNELGVGIPGRVSVTGMDDLPYAPITSPELTTVTNDGAAFVTEAFGMLIERIEGRYDGPGRRVEIPNRLIVRASTRAPDEDGMIVAHATSYIEGGNTQ